MAMLAAGIEFRVFEVVLRDKPAALIALSPKATVPVLHLSNGSVIDQSRDIMQWALEPIAASSSSPSGTLVDAPDWWRPSLAPANLALLDVNDNEFKLHLDRYKYPNRYPDETRSREDLRSHAVAVLLEPLERILQNRQWLGDKMPCATDLAIFPFIRQFAAVEPTWFADQPFPALHRWLAAWLHSPLFTVAMTRLPPESVTVFPRLEPTPQRA